MVIHVRRLYIYIDQRKKQFIHKLSGSTPTKSEKNTKEILKNTKEKSETGYLSFQPGKNLCRIFKMVVFIPEVLTLLLTPILTYINMVYDRVCHICHI